MTADAAVFGRAGHVAAYAATAVSGLPRARRMLRKQVLADAGETAVAGTYRCATWVGWDEIDAAAARIRVEIPKMLSHPNPLADIDKAVADARAISTDDDPPVVLLGLVAVRAEPAGLVP